MHPLLERQIRRYLHEGCAVPDDFLDAVSMAYEQSDTDRRFVEHSMEVMTTELTESNSRLQVKIGEQARLIRKLEETREQLLQSEKMASIGQLAAGVAHEINNPIGYISSNLGTLKTYVHDLIDTLQFYQVVESLMEEHADVIETIDAIKKRYEIEYIKKDVQDLLHESEEGIQRVKRIVQDLKDFSHMDETEWQWADIEHGIESTLNIVHAELKYKAEIIKEYANIPEVECIISQLNQVFLNIFVNAAHAIEERGTITIRTGEEDGGVWIEIEDTGKGMDSETRRKIFNPFFTTKPVGKGTGLGMSLSYGIVKKHNGNIFVDSEVGRGSKFHIWLPLQQNTLHENQHENIL